jgi:pyridoxamine 5'-phosphate oxidase
MIQSPISIFQTWYKEVRESGQVKHYTAFCLSTVDAQSHPQSRMLALRSFDERGIVFMSSRNSPKGVALANNKYASALFWWDALGRQVRVQGPVREVEEAECLEHYSSMPREAQLLAYASEQSRPISESEGLVDRLEQVRAEFLAREVPRAVDWLAYRLQPESFEFLTLKENRLHLREKYELISGEWKREFLQP